MRRHRFALRYIVAAYAALSVLAAWTVASSLSGADQKESLTSWSSTHRPPTVPLPPQSPKLGLTAETAIQPVANFATAVVAAQDNAAAAAFAAAEATVNASRSGPTVRSSSTTVAPAPSGDSSSIWDCIIAHESNGDPGAVNSSSGAGGLFQFLPSTWQANGGSGLPEDASVAEQWAIAEATQARDGWSPWIGDGCTPLG
jgi:hypothetical protein